MNYPVSLAVLSLCMVTSAASAQSENRLAGFYVGIMAGASWFGDQDIDTNSEILGIPIESDTAIEQQIGYRLGGNVGYQLDTNIRLQLDVGYAAAKGKNTVDVGNDALNTDQQTSILSGTGGVLLDLWPIGRFVPYVGAGFGVARVQVANDGEVGDSEQTVLTVFGEAGLPVNITPEIVLEPSFRFSWYDTEEQVDDVQIGFADSEIASIGENLYETQLLLKARYRF